MPGAHLIRQPPLRVVAAALPGDHGRTEQLRREEHAGVHAGASHVKARARQRIDVSLAIARLPAPAPLVLRARSLYAPPGVGGHRLLPLLLPGPSQLLLLLLLLLLLAREVGFTCQLIRVVGVLALAPALLQPEPLLPLLLLLEERLPLIVGRLQRELLLLPLLLQAGVVSLLEPLPLALPLLLLVRPALALQLDDAAGVRLQHLRPAGLLVVAAAVPVAAVAGVVASSSVVCQEAPAGGGGGASLHMRVPSPADAQQGAAPCGALAEEGEAVPGQEAEQRAVALAWGGAEVQDLLHAQAQGRQHRRAVGVEGKEPAGKKRVPQKLAGS